MKIVTVEFKKIIDGCIRWTTMYFVDGKRISRDRFNKCYSADAIDTNVWKWNLTKSSHKITNNKIRFIDVYDERYQPE